MKKHAFYIIIISLIQLLNYSCIKDKDDDTGTNYIEVGDAIPDFTVSGPYGTAASASFRNGKPGLITFFVTTCPDCQRELLKIQQVWDILQNEQEQWFTMATISREQKQSTVSSYWSGDEKTGRAPYTMPFYLDTDRVVYSLFADKTVPRFYITDGNGIVRWMAIENLGSTTATDMVEIMRGLL